MNIKFITLLLNSILNNTKKEAFFIGGKNYSYQAFYKKVNIISNTLLEEKGSQRKIIVTANNDLETYASIIAIWLTGNIYIPLDISNFNEDIKEKILQINPEIILSSTQVNSSYFNNTKTINTSSLENKSTPVQQKKINKNNIAYILFTSGSTGKPKGVPISYQNLDAFVDSFLSLDFSFSNNDNFLQMADLTFDMSIISTLIPLCVGAKITTISANEIKYLEAIETLSTQNISVLITAPSTLQLMQPYYSEINLEHLKHTFVGAEAFYESTAQQWKKCAPNSKIINLYGPSEGGILSTTHIWKEKISAEHNGIVSLGKPTKNINLYLVNEKGNIITDNEEGEAWISGKQVFNSYLDEAINKDCFGILNIGDKQEKCFKTGDFLFRDNDGNLFYCGRKDEQIKLQGKRIELSEIEHCANKIKSKFPAVAVSFKGAFDVNQIALFVDENIKNEKLTTHLKTYLPKYMMPSKIIGIASIPLTKNQKVDKKMLVSLLHKMK